MVDLVFACSCFNTFLPHANKTRTLAIRFVASEVAGYQILDNYPPQRYNSKVVPVDWSYGPVFTCS